LQAQLRLTLSDHSAFTPEVGKDLGKEFQQLLRLAKEGVRRALLAAEARSWCSDASPGGVRTVCALFDGLRIARRCAASTLVEAQEATVLTAAGVAALNDLDRQLGNLVAMAQREVGAADFLQKACDLVKSSGLEGTGKLLRELEYAISTAQKITQGPEDSEPLNLAGSIRRMEAELWPVFRELQEPTEVLWETRVVSVGDAMSEALRNARAEAGGWAVCADTAARLRKHGGETGLDQVAAAYHSASVWLRDDGLEAGARCLHGVRRALAALQEVSCSDPELEPLLQDAPRWLRDFVGAAAILRDAAEHRLGSRGSPGDCAAVREALLRAAECLDSGPKLGAKAPWDAAMLEFQRALALAPKGRLRSLLAEVDTEVLQVLGPCWAHEPAAAGGAPSDGDEARKGCRPDTDAAARCSGRQAAGAASAGAPSNGQQKACCTLL